MGNCGIAYPFDNPYSTSAASRLPHPIVGSKIVFPAIHKSNILYVSMANFAHLRGVYTTPIPVLDDGGGSALAIKFMKRFFHVISSHT
jgi:hypothetical protein